MTATSTRSRVVVIDPLKLRQAGLVRLLEDWAQANNLEIVATASPDDETVWPGCGMVVVNVGGASVLDSPSQRWIKSVRTVMSTVPVVILSDREECSEVRAAFKEGVSGFISTSLEPTLAMAALSFLSHGGSFFPCSVLLEESQSVREDTSRTLRGEQEAGVPAPRETREAGLEPRGVELEPHDVMHEPREADREARHMDNGPHHAEREPREVRHGHSAFRRTQVRISARRAAPDQPPYWSGGGEEALPSLTPRQREVLERLSEGKSNKLIARDLDMTEATVKVHVRQIMRKFGATNRTQAALWAMRFTSISMAKRIR